MLEEMDYLHILQLIKLGIKVDHTQIAHTGSFSLLCDLLQIITRGPAKHCLMFGVC